LIFRKQETQHGHNEQQSGELQNNIEQIEYKIQKNESFKIGGIAQKPKNCFHCVRKYANLQAMFQIKIGLMVIVALSACTQRGAKTAEKTEMVLKEDWNGEVLSFRKQKDNAFAIGAESPVISDQLNFKGLKYYKPNAAFRVPVSLVSETQKNKILEILDSKGMKRRMNYRGILKFAIDKKNFALPALVFLEDSLHYFVMFRDKTSGIETYGGGRFIEVPIFSDSGILDFNFAYNPFCHYNHEFSCPVVPKDNYLDLEIEAGEKKYP